MRALPTRVLLHPGSPKCGSTYLQRVLLENRAALAAAGVAYPHDGGPHPGNAAGLAGIDRAGLARMAAGAETLVLSHEDLFAQPARGAALAALAAEEGIAVQVLAFLRPFSDFIFGDYSQFLKQHFERYLETRRPHEGRGFERFAVDRARGLTPAGYLRGWARLFPGRPPLIAPHREIRATLTPWLGEAAVDWRLPPDRANPSLRMADCDAIAAALRDPAVPAAEVRGLYRAAFHRAGQEDPGRTPERIAWIEALFDRQRRDLRESFGFDTGDPAPPAPPSGELSGAPAAPPPITPSRTPPHHASDPARDRAARPGVCPGV